MTSPRRKEDQHRSDQPKHLEAFLMFPDNLHEKEHGRLNPLDDIQYPDPNRDTENR